MGCSNQVEFLRRHAHLVKGPVLEVGSKRYGKSGYDLRQLLPGIEYVGADLEAGPGVDAIADLSAPITETRAVLGWSGFRSVVCFSVLEHCSAPWQMARNIEALTYKGGLLFVSVPWVWKEHNYPADFWRFSEAGIRALFPCFDWDQYPVEKYECSQPVKHLLTPTLINAIGVRK